MNLAQQFQEFELRPNRFGETLSRPAAGGEAPESIPDPDAANPYSANADAANMGQSKQRTRPLTDSPATRATLLLRLRDSDDTDAWSQFIRDYGPMLYRFVRGRGLQDADAADLVQDVMRAVGASIARLDYDKQKGGFRAWLFTITRNKLYSYFEKRARSGNARGDTDQLEQLKNTPADNDPLSQRWELEHQRQLAARAMETIQIEADPKTWSAFQLTAVEGLSAKEVGDRLGMSGGAVYVARSRITAKLRDEVQRLLNEEEMTNQ